MNLLEIHHRIPKFYIVLLIRIYYRVNGNEVVARDNSQVDDDDDDARVVLLLVRSSRVRRRLSGRAKTLFSIFRRPLN